MLKKATIVVVCLSAAILGYSYYKSRQIKPYIADYEECVSLGGQVNENQMSCTYKDGQIFTNNNPINKTEGTSTEDMTATDVVNSPAPAAKDECAGLDAEDFLVDEVYNGAIAEPNLVSNQGAVKFQGLLNEATDGQVNFAGHYIIVELSCGSDCQQHAIMDAMTGKILTVGLESNYGLKYDIKSALLVVNPKENLPGINEQDINTVYYRLSSDSRLEEICRQAAASKILADTTSTYNDSEAGFSFAYPSSITIGQSATATKAIWLTVEKNKIASLEGTMGYDKATAEKDKQSLIAGQYGEAIDFPVDGSQKVSDLGGIKGKEFIVLSRFEVCSVLFERKLVFYLNDYQIIITLFGDPKIIADSQPDFFAYDKKNCVQNKIWKDAAGFYRALTENNGSIQAQLWYDSFADIIKSIKFE